MFTYIYLYYHKNIIIIIGPYEYPFYFQIQFFIFLYSVLMVKLNFINQKACLINWVLQFICTKSYFLDSILMVPLFFFYYFFFPFQKYCTFTFFS